MGISNSYIAASGQINPDIAPLRRISTTTLTGASAAVNITGIPTGYKRLIVFYEMIRTAGNANLYLQINADVGNTYGFQTFGSQNQTIFANGAAANPAFQVVTQINCTENITGMMVIENQATKTKGFYSAGGTTLLGQVTIGRWNNTTDEISQLNFLNAIGDFAIGSRFTIYGCYV